MTNLIRVLCLLILAFAVVGPFGSAAAANTIIAQNATTTGGITGTVKDASGAPVAGATVRLSGPTNDSTQSDSAGSFSFTNVTPGLYVLSVTKPGYETAVSQSLPVIANVTQSVQVSMQSATLKSLNVIASVVARTGTFNTSTASSTTITAQTFTNQAQPQVMQILNQTPGIVASYPGGSANGAVPGAITFPNIRGALSFETASLIDGHPVSVGRFGDYVTTFLNSFMLQSIELVKGPGAAAPETNYAIGGTVNFVTRDPTYKPTGILQVGGGTFGSRILNAAFTGTSPDGKWGWVLAYALNDTPGPFNNTGIFFDPGGSGIIAGVNGGNTLPFQNWKVTGPNVFQDSAPFNATSLVACCQPASSSFHNQSQLVKLRYAFSHSTVATLSYFGSQTNANQTANTSSQVFSIFDPSSSGGFTPNSPPAPYTGVIHPGHLFLNQPFFATNEEEFNNEPIFEADLRTTVGNDTLLFRGYTATINRLANQGGDNPNIPQTMNLQLFGTAYTSSGNPLATFNGQVVPMQFFGYFHQFEQDALRGYSVEYDHNIGNNVISLAYDHTHSSTFAGVNQFDSFNTPMVDAIQDIPPGSTQDFGTILLRGIFYVGDKLQLTGSAYLNTYRSRFAVNCVGGCPEFPNPQPFGFIFDTSETSHFDVRVGGVYRPNSNVALRFAAGSSIAPPFLDLLSQVPGTITNSFNGYATQAVNAGGLHPETAFGYDVGADLRFNGGIDTVSTDIYLTNLFNQFITQAFALNETCVPHGSGSACAIGTGPTAIPIFGQRNTNLTNAQYEGIELAYHHAPAIGLGWVVQGAMQAAYPYNLSPCFYHVSQPCTGAPNTNLAVIPGINFLGGVGGLANGVSNQNIPYSQGYGEINYHSPSGLYASFGETYIGNNNSYNLKPFFIGNASLRWSLHQGQSIQLSAFNLWNTNSGLYPLLGAGIPIGLANGQTGLTQANVIGPRLVTLVFTQNFGSNP